MALGRAEGASPLGGCPPLPLVVGRQVERRHRRRVCWPTYVTWGCSLTTSPTKTGRLKVTEPITTVATHRRVWRLAAVAPAGWASMISLT
jgi:hypothetical protein